AHRGPNGDQINDDRRTASGAAQHFAPSALVTSSRLRSFEGAVAIVTGAASGIGRALSEELARRGASVVLADLQEQVRDAAADISSSSGRSASACTLDVTDFDSVKRLVERVAEEQGRLDYLFNNPALPLRGHLRNPPIPA